MNAPLYSPQWHEVAPLRPALRSAVRARRLHSRGRNWQLLSTPESRRQLRLNTAAWRFVGLLDGKHTIDTLWQRLQAQFGDDAPSQPEVLDLLAQLSDAGMLRADVIPDLPTQFDHARRQSRKQRLAALSPLAVRVRLFDPSALLERLAPVGRHLFNLPALCAWLVLVGMTALHVGSEWSRLATALGQALQSQRFVVIAWVVYPLMKALHELAHGIAVRRWGGTVPTAGFTLLVLVPVPYLDASAANGFERAQRVVVSAAGILCELLIAALAFWVWSGVSPGLVQDVALTAFFIGAVSAPLFNGNPLLRFDGYYAFSDALDLPNLASRSRRWWQLAIARHLLRLQPPPMVLAPGETPWLAIYAPAAWGFQIIIGIQIARWIAGFSTALGTLAALFLFITLLCLPLWRAVQAWTGGPPSPAQRRARRRLGLALAATLAGLVALPLPSATRVPGVLALPDPARLHTDTAGFVAELLARDGTPVVAGQPVVRLDDPALATAERAVLSQLVALQARRYGQLLSNPREAGDVAAQIAALEQDLADICHRIAALALRAGVDGRVALAQQDDLPGTYLPQGHTLGYVVPDTGMTVRAVIGHEQIAHIRAATESVSVLPAGAAGAAIPARATRFAEGATHTLPSAALSERFGGPIATPANDPDGQRAIAALFEVELSLDAMPIAGRPGERVWVRFAHPDEPLAMQWARRGRQLLLQFVNEAG